MQVNKLKTFHAPAERLNESELQKQVYLIEKNQLLNQAFNTANVIILIINNFRQLVFANKAFLDYLGMKSSVPILGKRPGEIIKCIHSEENIN